jgi:WD40 repeat protein
LIVNPEGTRIVSGTVRGEVMTHSLRDYQSHSLKSNMKQAVNGLSFSSFKRMVAASGNEAMVVLWDLNRSNDPFLVLEDCHSSPIVASQFSESVPGTLFTVGLDRHLKMHDLNVKSTW